MKANQLICLDLELCCRRLPRNSGTARRSESNPYGQECYESVLSGNRLAARTLIILWVCAALGVWWVLEQPQGSWMQELPVFQHLMGCLDCYRHRLLMGDFGGMSEKPTWLYSSYSISKIQVYSIERTFGIESFRLVWHPKKGPSNPPNM